MVWEGGEGVSFYVGEQGSKPRASEEMEKRGVVKMRVGSERWDK